MSKQRASVQAVAVFWFRRDLRFEDNVGLAAALKSGLPVVPLFIFDTEILDRLEDRDDARVTFIHRTIVELDDRLRKIGSSLLVEHGRPLEVWRRLVKQFQIREVFTNHDYEPSAILRDMEIASLLRENGATLRTFKDQVIFEKREVQKDSGGPYTVYTPYGKKWKTVLTPKHLETSPSARLMEHFSKTKHVEPLSLSKIGFRESGLSFPPAKFDRPLLRAYKEKRDTPSIRGTSRLGLHFRFGTLSIREAVFVAKETSETWLNELIWREFFMQILFNFPHVVGAPFRPEYANIVWRDDRKQFEAWCEGRTGVPLVDAGMRELNETGFMHNRVRMVAGSFLVKSLLMDWRLGEAYFARRLLDFELASNNGNWQWVAGTGCDAAPYFRIFNPDLQLKRFDPTLAYVRRWVPEYGTSRYPKPIVDHAFARERTLKEYARALGKSKKA